MNFLGFTGTQYGMTIPQLQAVASVLDRLRPLTVNHGDCVGADEQLDLLAVNRHIERVVRPGPDPDRRAFCDGELVFPPEPFLARNRKIVAASQHLVAAPGTMAEPTSTRGSGTWTTVKYARQAGLPITICWLDGTITEEPAPGQP